MEASFALPLSRPPLSRWPGRPSPTPCHPDHPGLLPVPRCARTPGARVRVLNSHSWCSSTTRMCPAPRCLLPRCLLPGSLARLSCSWSLCRRHVDSRALPPLDPPSHRGNHPHVDPPGHPFVPTPTHSPRSIDAAKSTLPPAALRACRTTAQSPTTPSAPARVCTLASSTPLEASSSLAWRS